LLSWASFFPDRVAGQDLSDEEHGMNMIFTESSWRIHEPATSRLYNQVMHDRLFTAKDTPTMITLGDINPRELVPGGRVRLIHSDSMTFAHWEFDAETPLPEHAHPHEQVVILLDGRFDLVVDGEIHHLEAGSIVSVPGGVVHSGYAVTESYVLDVFHPVRDDLK